MKTSFIASKQRSAAPRSSPSNQRCNKVPTMTKAMARQQAPAMHGTCTGAWLDIGHVSAQQYSCFVGSTLSMLILKFAMEEAQKNYDATCKGHFKGYKGDVPPSACNTWAATTSAKHDQGSSPCSSNSNADACAQDETHNTCASNGSSSSYPEPCYTGTPCSSRCSSRRSSGTGSECDTAAVTDTSSKSCKSKSSSRTKKHKGGKR